MASTARPPRTAGPRRGTWSAGLSGRLPDGPADPDDDVGLLGGGAVRRGLLSRWPPWLGPAVITAAPLLLLLLLSSVALHRASDAQTASAAASLLSQALITDRLNRVGALWAADGVVPAYAQHQHGYADDSGTAAVCGSCAPVFVSATNSVRMVTQHSDRLDSRRPRMLIHMCADAGSCRPLSQWPRRTWSAA